MGLASRIIEKGEFGFDLFLCLSGFVFAVFK